MKFCVASSLYSSVVVNRNQVFAATATFDQSGEVHVFENLDRGWEMVRRFSLERGGSITLAVYADQVTCCSAWENKMASYSLSGELLQTHGRYGSSGPGQLICPAVCDVDDDGRTLIVDIGNDRLQVMSEQGEFNVLQLQPPVAGPSRAVLFNGCLYLVSHNNRSIHKYE